MKIFKTIPSCTLPYRPSGLVGEPLCGVGAFNMNSSTPICGIYKITSPTGKIYIGQSKNCEQRKKSYEKVKCKKQRKIYHSLLKYGWEAHVFTVIKECTIEELDSWEKYYISFYGTFNSEHGLNLRDGGLRSIPSEETRKRASEAQKKKYQNEGYVNPRKGVKLDEIGRLNVSIAQKQRWLIEKTTEKYNSEEAKKKRIEPRLGSKNGMFGNGEKLAGSKNGRFGKPVSQETRDKISRANKLYSTRIKAEGLANERLRESLLTKKSIYLAYSSGMRVKDLSILIGVSAPVICHYIKKYREYLQHK